MAHHAQLARALALAPEAPVRRGEIAGGLIFLFVFLFVKEKK